MSCALPAHAKCVPTRLKAYAKTVVDLLFVPRLKRDEQMLDKLQGIPELLPVLCRLRGRGAILANQDVQELGAPCDKLLERPPRVVVEVGTAKGGTLYLWTRICAPGGLVVSIDKPGEVGSVGRSTLSVFRRFGRERGIQVFTIAADSQSHGAHERLRRILADHKVDFLFIDGDHHYEGVKADFYGCEAYMGPEGIVASTTWELPTPIPKSRYPASGRKFPARVG